ncbi:uncharacterized protein LOC129584460 [Paramacrobiotus metropolitanus]|uniref:uncharacterized protein LOC129584460 n=1 Tax=Paramacrobiotus metropolitanus TaxID=2943436 RepID=UPI002445668B|nr:uncharacterized protein LOC129584460 [Paramacrobiotus metropolitanus]
MTVLYLVSIFRTQPDLFTAWAPLAGASLVSATIRTFVFVKLNRKAAKLADIVADRITKEPYGSYKQNAVIWLMVTDRRHIGFDVGGLVPINSRFVLGISGVLATYIMLMWDGERSLDSSAAG